MEEKDGKYREKKNPKLNLNWKNSNKKELNLNRK